MQTKLAIGAVNDPLEREADQAAEQVFHAPTYAGISSLSSRPLQRKCRTCSEEQETKEDTRDKLLRKGSGPDALDGMSAPPAVHQVLGSPGQPLDPSVRVLMESRLGGDFSQVRLHTDLQAAESAREVNALAYTVGHDVVFAEHQFSPSSQSGQRLLAHELAHVIQQSGTPTSRAGGKFAAPLARTEKPAAPILQRDTPQGQSQTQSAPIEKERDFRFTPRISPDILGFTMDYLRGRYAFSLQADYTQPLSLINSQLFGTGQFSASLGYRNRCNSAFQSALIGLEQTQQRGGPFDFRQDPWRIMTSAGIRIGSIRFDPNLGVSFAGSRFDGIMIGLSFAAASTTVPDECREIITHPPAPPTRTPPGPESQPGGGPGGQTGGRPPGGGGTPQPAPRPELLPRTIYFFYDTSVWRPEGNAPLSEITDLLRTFPSIHVHVTGHTSLEGTDAYNLDLSRRRANAIRDSLVRAGIDGSRIVTLGMGEFAPAVAEPDIPQHLVLPSLEAIRNQNRRVEVTFFDPTGGSSSSFSNVPTFPPLRLSEPPPRHSLTRPRLGGSE